MVLGIVGSERPSYFCCCPPIFVAANEHLNAAAYQALLSWHVIPWLTRAYTFMATPSSRWGTLPYDSHHQAAHGGKDASLYLLPYSPDLSPLECSIWSIMESKLHDKCGSPKELYWAAVGMSYI